MKIAARSARSGTGLVLGLSLLFGGFCPPVSAQGFRGGGGFPSPEDSFRRMDRNQNGQIDPDEFGFLRDIYARVGIDVSRPISQQEFIQASQKMREQFEQARSSGDFSQFRRPESGGGSPSPGGGSPSFGGGPPSFGGGSPSFGGGSWAASIDGPKNPLTAIDEVIVTGAKTETGIAAEIPRRISRPKNPQSRKFVSPRIFPATIASKTQMATGKLACTNGTAKLSRNSLTWTAMVMAC